MSFSHSFFCIYFDSFFHSFTSSHFCVTLRYLFLSQVQLSRELQSAKKQKLSSLWRLTYRDTVCVLDHTSNTQNTSSSTLLPPSRGTKNRQELDLSTLCARQDSEDCESRLNPLIQLLKLITSGATRALTDMLVTPVDVVCTNNQRSGGPSLSVVGDVLVTGRLRGLLRGGLTSAAVAVPVKNQSMRRQLS